MSLADEIKKGAKDFIERMTGKPAEALRPATQTHDPFEDLNNFARRAQERPQAPFQQPDTHVKSTTTIVPGHGVNLGDDTPPTPVGAGGVQAGTSTAVRYVDVSGGSPTTATGNFLKV